MKKTLRIILATLLLAACTFAFYSCSDTPTAWETDYTVAQKQAEEQNKEILIFFSGYEWDGISTGLMENFLSTKKFMKAAGKEFILLNADVPSDVTNMTDDEYTNLMILTTTCNVNSCPAIIAMDLDGSPYYELAYQDGVTTLDELVSDVKNAGKVKKSIQTLEGKLQTVNGKERVEVIDELVSIIPEAYVGRYYELMASVPLVDPDNESGLVGKYTLVAAEQRATLLLYQGDYLGAVDAFAQAAGSRYLSVEQKQECLYYSAYFAAQMDLWELAIDYMEKAYVLAPDSNNGMMISEMLPQMKANLEAYQQDQTTEEEE